MIRSIIVTSTGAGSKVRATSANTPQEKCQWISVAADPDNTGFLAHGDATITAEIGQQIAPGGGSGIIQYPPCSGLMSYGYMLSELYIYFEAADDKAQINFMTR